MSAASQTQGPGCQPYLIGPPDLDPERLEAVLATGEAVAFRLHAAAQGHARAAPLQRVCAGRTAFLVEDDVELALAIGADGVHLADPARLRDARARLGPDRILGASCGYSRHAAMLAGEDGADYIAFGEVGRRPQPLLLELIAWWNGLFVLPCLALGAFDGAGCREVVRAGADFIGLCDEVWRHPDGAASGLQAMRRAIGGT